MKRLLTLLTSLALSASLAFGQNVCLRNDSDATLLGANLATGQAVSCDLTGKQKVLANLTPVTSGGLSISRTIAGASTNSTSVKASAGQVYGWYISNVNASARFVKFYNSASAPTCGSGTPVMTLVIPGNTSGAGTNVDFGSGLAFSTGIGFCVTGAVADNDTTAVSANDVIVNLFYK